ncbi:MAG: helix-turn-helix domain-containing protein [Chitinophagales bacterium]|nr:helix-turn-helix domain-containing protein [Chitinophagales bacterium]
MRIFNFNHSKYGKELLIDGGSKSDFGGYFLENEEHATDFYELIFWESGSGSLLLDDRKTALKPHSVIFISPYKKRKWQVSKSAVSFRILLFREDFLNEFLKNHLFLCNMPCFYGRNPGVLVLNMDQWKETMELTEKIITEIRQLQADSVSMLQAQLIYLLSLLSRQYTRQYELSADHSGNILSHRFRRMLDTGLKEGFTVSDYARELGTSRVTLNKYCVSSFGITAGELLRQRLLYEVKSALLYSNHSLKEIVDMLGFKEMSNLSRFFRHLTGMTITEYKKAYAPGQYY